VAVILAPTPEASFTYTGNSYGNPTNFTDLSTGDNLVSWFWDFGDGYTGSTQNIYHTYEVPDSVFVVSLRVTNSFGCYDDTVITIQIDKLGTVSNLFTPNNDGNNDYFWIQNGGAKNYGIDIFNRWGQEVYSSEGREIRWDGKTNAGVVLEAGTYYYVLKVYTVNGIIEKTGFVSLFR
jgi:gliding motility-associated-like protein